MIPPSLPFPFSTPILLPPLRKQSCQAIRLLKEIVRSLFYSGKLFFAASAYETIGSPGHMPKRDAAYMKQQRDSIVRAAFQVLVEKGMQGTSLRDICAAAGVSIGALYTHFDTTDEVVLAACELEQREYESVPLAESWAAHVDTILMEMADRPSLSQRRRFRLSLELMARLVVSEDSPAMSRTFAIHRSRLTDQLRYFAERGEITLPLGLELAVTLHMQLLSGAAVEWFTDPEADFSQKRLAVAAGLAWIVGAQSGVDARVSTTLEPAEAS